MNETDKPAVNDTIPWEVLVNDESARAAFSARQLERIADSLLRMEEWIDRVASIQDARKLVDSIIDRRRTSGAILHKP